MLWTRFQNTPVSIDAPASPRSARETASEGDAGLGPSVVVVLDDAAFSVVVVSVESEGSASACGASAVPPAMRPGVVTFVTSVSGASGSPATARPDISVTVVFGSSRAPKVSTSTTKSRDAPKIMKSAWTTAFELSPQSETSRRRVPANTSSPLSRLESCTSSVSAQLAALIGGAGAHAHRASNDDSWTSWSCTVARPDMVERASASGMGVVRRHSEEPRSMSGCRGNIVGRRRPNPSTFLGET
jgi:hypothetical protein